MKNVIIFAVENERYAVELRWVREIFTLGHVTPVPGAPVHVIGAINVRGMITPVLDISQLALRPQRGGEDSSSPGGPRSEREFTRAGTRAGDGALLIDAESATAALRIAKVDEVSTASYREEMSELVRESAPATALAGTIIDSHGREVALIDPPALVHLSLAMARSLHGIGAPARDPGQGRSAVERDTPEPGAPAHGMPGGGHDDLA